MKNLFLFCLFICLGYAIKTFAFTDKADATWLRNEQRLFKKDLIIDNANPWDSAVIPYQVKNNNTGSYKIYTLEGMSGYGAFVITNLSDNSREVSCDVDNGTTSIAALHLYTVPYIVAGATHKQYPDPLLENTSKIDLASGESRWFLYKVTGKNTGTATAHIYVRSDNFFTTLSVAINVKNDVSIDTNSLGTINWAYLNYPMLADRQDAAVSDLLSHHINSMVVPSDVMPAFGNQDYTAYKTYIGKLKKFKNLFLLTNPPNKSKYNNLLFMSDAWKSAFITWYEGIIKASAEEGFSAAQLYIYHYDEPHGPKIDEANNFFSWVKKEHPEMKIYGTLSQVDALAKLKPLLSISQLHENVVPTYQQSSQQYGDGQTWTYQTRLHSETLSPYSYYRLQAWEAFYYGYTGIGFWDYADYHRKGSDIKVTLDNFDGVNDINYSVIYDGSDGSIISSRRWEAFSAGVEDYWLLTRYKQKYGAAKARALASGVFNDPSNTAKAEQARLQMLSEL